MSMGSTSISEYTYKIKGCILEGLEIKAFFELNASDCLDQFLYFFWCPKRVLGVALQILGKSHEIQAHEICCL